MSNSDVGHTGVDGTDPVTVDLSESAANRPSTVILETVMELTGKDVTELPPLTEGFDPDALDSLFPYTESPSTDDVAAAGLARVNDDAADETAAFEAVWGHVRLTIDDIVVTVSADGVIQFEP